MLLFHTRSEAADILSPLHAVSLFFALYSVFIDDFLSSARTEGDQFPQLEFEQLPFSHPLFIMYSSGTTGAPKCMVHSAGVRDAEAPVSPQGPVQLARAHVSPHTAGQFMK